MASRRSLPPEVGLGINGQGIIDTPWMVICDLTNNPPALQAQGYLFLYWQVRYLNVIRYFVVKFQGGGNVTVTAQSTAAVAAQFAASVNTSVANPSLKPLHRVLLARARHRFAF